MARIEPNEMKAVPDGRIVVPIGPPQTRPAQPITAGTATRGQRVVWCRPEGFEFDLRATCDPYPRDGDGLLAVQFVPEAAWYAWQLVGTPPDPVEVLAYTVFVERPPILPSQPDRT